MEFDYSFITLNYFLSCHKILVFYSVYQHVDSMLRKLSSIYFFVNVISNFCTLTNEYATSAINDFRQKKREKKLLDRTKSILCGPIMLLGSKIQRKWKPESTLWELYVLRYQITLKYSSYRIFSEWKISPMHRSNLH